MYKVVASSLPRTTGFQTERELLVKRTYVLIPFCTFCRRAKRIGHIVATVVGLIALVGTATYLRLQNYVVGEGYKDPKWSIPVSLLVSVVLWVGLSWLVRNMICWCGMRGVPGIKGALSTMDFPPIRKLATEGWKQGKRPRGATEIKDDGTDRRAAYWFHGDGANE